MKRTAVIMAGGSGERFYPLSRRTRPKQLLPLVHPHKTMIEESIERIAPVVDVKDIYIITSAVLLPHIRAVVTAVPPENIIAEPHKRNTAPCLALAASVLCAKYGDAKEISVAVVTADQYIDHIDVFRSQVQQAMEYAEHHAEIVTLGIAPSRPETGYGYIEIGEKLENDICRVKSFREKPDRQTAEQFLSDGSFVWNSGMFFYRCDTFVNGMKKHAPEIGNQLEAMAIDIASRVHTAPSGPYDEINDLFASLPDISIDYALMEVAPNVVVLPSRFPWDDVGSWDSLERTNTPDADHNVCVGVSTVVDTKESIIANYSSANAMMISVIGMENVVVVATDDSIVVVPKDRVQEVKKAVALMKERGQDSWL
jgi:mannose-1-phosphate guanylyltransferase